MSEKQTDKKDKTIKYDFHKLQEKWTQKWEEKNLYKAEDFSEKPEKYVLVEFPYPSGSGLHMGHGFTMTGADIHARYMRMTGHNVIFPMGWDAFGLPTENFAIKNKIKPQEATAQNVANFKKEMKQLAFSFDWEREVNTTDPNYYKWTQWIFLKLYEKGLAYKEEKPINWCPSCKIGLANEEVVDGACERCGTPATKKNMSQWMLKITAYADRLIDELEETEYPGHVKARQINWIGRKAWIDINYPIDGTDEVITVSTTRPDTNFGATFVVIAPEHEIWEKLIPKMDEATAKQVKEYIAQAKNKSELERISEGREKTGVFSGFYCVNNLSGRKMPMYVTDFVLTDVGTGAVVGVPGHDMRDFEFAKKFELPIIRVVVGSDGDTSEISKKEQVQEEEGTMINSEFLNGLDIHEATTKVMDYIESKGWGKKTMRYHLRDWLFSRQHYWGEPIPLIKCETCGWVPVPEEQLPIVLPEVDHYEPTDTGESPLAAISEWVNVKCPKCGEDAKRETDTMPNWAGSSWYYLRYVDPNNSNELADKDKLEYWSPVDVYVGGSEHTTLHLLYSRFWHKVLNDIGAVPGHEPYIRRVEHGVILGPDGKRMSKSKGNVILPEHVTTKIGVDAARTYMMFIGPFEGTMAWSDTAMMGVKRFVDRFYKYIIGNIGKYGKEDSADVAFFINNAIKAITDSVANFRYNTGVAKLMETLNALEAMADASMVSQASIEKLVIMASVYMPYAGEEMWEALGHADSVHTQTWPAVDETKIVQNEIEVPVQINGKMRGRVKVSVDASEEVVRNLVETDSKLATYMLGKSIRKFIYVAGKIINVVTD
ncbi:MAG: leucine--tRNA ligase [Candidatus Dojkabacteria bacterium]